MWKVGGGHCVVPLAVTSRRVTFADVRHFRGPGLPLGITDPGAAASWMIAGFLCLLRFPASETQKEVSEPAMASPDFCSFGPLSTVPQASNSLDRIPSA